MRFGFCERCGREIKQYPNGYYDWLSHDEEREECEPEFITERRFDLVDKIMRHFAPNVLDTDKTS